MKIDTPMAGSDSIKLTRTIHPVGQGGFYTEIFGILENGSPKEHCFVYDCGSTSLKESQLKKILLSSIPSKMGIDALFISHFDADHVNGIKILAEQRNVNCLVMPQVDGYEWFYIIADCLENEREQADGDLVGRIRNICVDKGIKIIQVRPFVNDESNERLAGRDEIRIDSLSSNGNDPLPNCSKIVFPSVGGLVWEYVPINTADDQNILLLRKKLEAFLKEHTSNECDLSSLPSKEIVDMISKFRSSINGIYKEVFGNANKSSMCLYSGSLTPNNTTFYHHCRLEFFCYYRCPLRHFDWVRDKDACLYTGDAILTDNKLWPHIQKVLSKRLGRIGLIQIPHHGSLHNSNEEVFSIFKENHPVLFVSYGYSNTYGHPSNYLISTLLRSEMPVCQVTDWMDSAMYQIITVE